MALMRSKSRRLIALLIVIAVAYFFVWPSINFPDDDVFVLDSEDTDVEPRQNSRRPHPNDVFDEMMLGIPLPVPVTARTKASAREKTRFDPGTKVAVSTPVQFGISDKIPVLIMACNRPSIERALNSVFKYRPSNSFPVIVSQDCNDAETSSVIDSFGSRLIHIKQPLRSDPEVEPGNHNFLNYYKIARHYKFALSQVFEVLEYEQVIIVEDDMEIAPDFFDYFAGFLPVFKQDKSLLCVSSWNDNGKRGLVASPDVFYRSDFFPGLGWMLTKALWDELGPKWPKTFWDDWLREPEQRKDRACIRPEISRTFNFGKDGVSAGQYYDQHIATIVLNKEPIKYALGPTAAGSEVVDVGAYTKFVYDKRFKRQVFELSKKCTTQELMAMLGQADPTDNPLYGPLSQDPLEYCGKGCLRRYRILYEQRAEWLGFVDEAQQWNLMTDIRANVARTSYGGIVCFKAPFSKPPSDSEVAVEVCLVPKSKH